ncbi:Y-family DNA polymerase [Bacillus xiapuensis]|uniref:Y-family DNA polymerase n=1 Tax=Bacillus xiapuensis TaxID=2014075 RepID=UPI000C23F02A|nr:UV damage repair protein UvrX [Bacillus xiapuensis]
MVDYSQLDRNDILCVDMKSFYASCSAVMHGLDPLSCYLAVVSDRSRQGSVVLAASPKLKKEFGVRTGARLFEIPDDPRIQIVEPQMNLYLRISVEITKLLSRYAPPSAIHVYSVDESFIKIDGTASLWGDAATVAKKIRFEMDKEFQLPCAVGIGPNRLMAKLSLDLEAKKKGIAVWSYEDVPSKLWPLAPLSKMWGIGKPLERRLNRMGIFTVGQLAQYDLKKLEAAFGVIGNQLYYHAWGVDLSEMGEPLPQRQLSFSKSQILLRDYSKRSEVQHVILEMCEEVARRAREHKQAGRTISLGIGYSKEESGGGFYRSRTMERPTNTTMDLYEACLALLREFDSGKAVRKITVALSRLTAAESVQLDLFQPNLWKSQMIGYTIDRIRRKHGPTALLRAVSYTEAGTARRRASLTGGHKAY